MYHLQTTSESQEFDKISDYKVKRQKKNISIIIPTYKEEALIGKLIDAISSQMIGLDYEIVVVDDSSPDNTSKEVIGRFGNTEEVVLLERKKRGVFSAQLDGTKVATGEILVLMDADFSHPPQKIRELISVLNQFDIVSCSRFLKESKMIAPFTRKYSTIAFNYIIRILLNFGISDYTSIFFAVKRNSWEKLKFHYDSIWGEAGMEIFKQARLNNLLIKEIPFIYNYREEGESKADNYLKYAFVYMKRALQVRFFYKNGTK